MATLCFQKPPLLTKQGQKNGTEIQRAELASREVPLVWPPVAVTALCNIKTGLRPFVVRKVSIGCLHGRQDWVGGRCYAETPMRRLGAGGEILGSAGEGLGSAVQRSSADSEVVVFASAGWRDWRGFCEQESRALLRWPQRHEGAVGTAGEGRRCPWIVKS